MLFRYIIKTGKEKIKPCDPSPQSEKTEHESTSIETSKNETTPEPNSIEAAPPKKKRKGQNKARPRTVPKVESEFRICPTILRNEECKFGSNCKFTHDIEKYIQHKPADIGRECINYRRTGKCPYGIECRYGSEHISEDHKNIIDEERYASYCETFFNDNTLKKETMIALRKKQYKFLRSEKYLSRSTVAVVDIADEKSIGAVTDEDQIKLRSNEKKKVGF